MMREDEYREFKKTTGELNEAMVSVSAMLNKHKHGKVYFGLRNDGTPNPFTITDSTLRDVSRKVYESIKPQLIPVVDIEEIEGIEVITLTFSGEDVPYSAFGKSDRGSGRSTRFAMKQGSKSHTSMRKRLFRLNFQEMTGISRQRVA